jgi:hypothetical protein
MLAQDRQRTQDSYTLWGQEGGEERHISTQAKDDIRTSGIFNTHARIASPYRRLKLAMDYWCALWFWPLEKVDQLPDRQKWLFDLNTILNSAGTFAFAPEQESLLGGGDPAEDGAGEDLFAKPVEDLFAADEPQQSLREENRPEARAAREVSNQRGELNLEKLFSNPFFATLRLANELGEHYRFFHWELAFADLFATAAASISPWATRPGARWSGRRAASSATTTPASCSTSSAPSSSPTSARPPSLAAPSWKPPGLPSWPRPRAPRRSSTQPRTTRSSRACRPTSTSASCPAPGPMPMSRASAAFCIRKASTMIPRVEAFGGRCIRDCVPAFPVHQPDQAVRRGAQPDAVQHQCPWALQEHRVFKHISNLFIPQHRRHVLCP